MAVNDLAWIYSLWQFLEYVSCFATNEKVVPFVTLLLEEVVQSQSNYLLWPPISEISAGVYHITAFKDRVNQSIKHQQVICLIKTTFVSSHSYRAYFKILLII